MSLRSRTARTVVLTAAVVAPLVPLALVPGSSSATLPAALPATAPAGIQADFPARVSVTPWTGAGHVTGTTTPGGLPVQVEARTPSGEWVTLGETRSAADGAYRLPVPTFWVGRHRLRATVPENPTTATASSSTTGTVVVRRGHRLGGSSQHRFTGDPDRARWNPCRVLTYRINPARAPRHARASLRFVTRAISAESGHRFRYAGTTDHVPYTRAGDDPDQAGYTESDVVVAWATPRQVPGLAGSVAGLGGFQSWSDGDVMAGGVVVDATTRRTRGQERELLLHELGHVLGLGHVEDPRQVMSSSLSREGQTRLGRGDVAGLRRVGAAAGCHPADQPARPGADLLARRTGSPVTVVLP